MRRWMSVVKTLGSNTEETRGRMIENRMQEWGYESEERNTEKESLFICLNSQPTQTFHSHTPVSITHTCHTVYPPVHCTPAVPFPVIT